MLTPHFRAHLGEIFGTILTSAAGITATQAQVEWWLRMVLLVVGIASGVLTIRSLLRKDRRD